MRLVVETGVKLLIGLMFAIILINMISKVTESSMIATVLTNTGGWGWELLKFLALIIIPLAMIYAKNIQEMVVLGLGSVVSIVMAIMIYFMISSVEASGITSSLGSYEFVWEMIKLIASISLPIALLMGLYQSQLFTGEGGVIDLQRLLGGGKGGSRF